MKNIDNEIFLIENLVGAHSKVNWISTAASKIYNQKVYNHNNAFNCETTSDTLNTLDLMKIYQVYLIKSHFI